MQFEFKFLFSSRRERRAGPHLGTLHLQSSRNPVPLRFVRHRRARRYILRLLRDGSARVTVPRWGSLRQAHEFACANTSWLERQLRKQSDRAPEHTRWRAGTLIYFRGEPLPLEVSEHGLRFGDQYCPPAEPAGRTGTDLRPRVERHLLSLASAELPVRVENLARANGITVRRVSIRNQRTRWGSCSRKGTVSLNWRLVQAPEFVRDYIILHELAHMKEMNHSRRFWAEVERLYPGYKHAELWLKQHSWLLR